MKKTVFLIFSALIVLSFIIIFTCNGIVRHAAQGKCYSVVEDIPQCNYGILLGTGRSVAYSPYYVARVQAAVDLLKAKKIDMLIISGENLDSNYQEVDSMTADILASVPEATIHLDIYGTDTYTTLRNAGNVFGNSGSYILISQHFHNQRALFYAKFLFQDCVAFDASDTDSFWWRTRNFVREWLARTKAVLMLPVLILS